MSQAHLAEDIDLLNAGFGREPGVHFVTSPLGGTVAELAAGGARAVVALQGGQVLSFVPAGGSDLLWVSPAARLRTGKAVRGGIPVCWPWFGPHPLDPGAPAHGFVRTVDWRPAGSDAMDGEATLRLTCPFPEEHRERWAQVAGLSLEITLQASRLSVTLATRNLGQQPLVLTEALHTYFAVSDIDAVEIIGFDGLSYIDKLASGTVKQQQGPIRFAAEVDRIYADDGPRGFIVDAGRRQRIVVAKSGSRSTVVWNPWIDKCARLGDMGPDGYRHMVCVETANCGHANASIAPGEVHRLALELSAAPI